MINYKWIVSDLDGTIIFHSENGNIIFPEVINSINKYIELGGKFTIATGRHYVDVISIVKNNKINFKDDFFIVGMNGGQIYSWGEKKLIYNATLPNDKLDDIKPIIKNLYKKFKDDIIIFGYGENENIYTIKSNNDNFQKLYDEIIQYEDNQEVFNYLILNEDELFSLSNISKFCISFNYEVKNPKDLINELSKLSDDIYFIQTGPSFFEIMPNNINKGSAIKLINDNFYKLNNNFIMALGDSGNDIDMFKYVGKSVTRKCAPEYIKKEATEISDDGPSMFVKSSINKYGIGE